MGCGMSTEEKEGKERNEQIENQLKRDKLSQRNEIKMLLLGTFMAEPCRPHLILDADELFRSWRVWQIDNFKTDEAHPRGKLFKR